MSTPPPPRSPYRERRINAMLQDHGSLLSPTSEPPLPSKQPPKGNRHVLIVSITVAILCAATVFFLLFRRDATQSTPVAHAIPQAATPSAATPPPTLPIAETARVPQPAAEPLTKAPEPQPIRFQLKRSDRFQTFGPLKLRLLSTTPRRGMCQIAIAAGEDHSRTRSVSMNRTVQIQGKDGASLDLQITGMTRDNVKGSVIAHEQQSAQ